MYVFKEQTYTLSIVTPLPVIIVFFREMRFFFVPLAPFEWFGSIVPLTKGEFCFPVLCQSQIFSEPTKTFDEAIRIVKLVFVVQCRLQGISYFMLEIHFDKIREPYIHRYLNL